MAQLGALYLATHAVGTAAGWQIMADAQPLEPVQEEDEEDLLDDEEDASAQANKQYEYAARQPDPVLDRVTRYNIFCLPHPGVSPYTGS